MMQVIKHNEFFVLSFCTTIKLLLHSLRFCSLFSILKQSALNVAPINSTPFFPITLSILEVIIYTDCFADQNLTIQLLYRQIPLYFLLLLLLLVWRITPSLWLGGE